MIISINYKKNDSILRFAANELEHFLNEMSGAVVIHNAPSGCDFEFGLAVDARMKSGSFAVKGSQRSASLRGYDSGCAVHAVYQALEIIGVYFEVTGYVLPAKFSLDPLKTADKTVVPFTKVRSIKHYCNFAVDISGFSQREARDVVLNSVRLKYNTISFQIFEGFWFPQENEKTSLLAGNFFYNAKHVIPGVPLLRERIGNHRVYCIPEAEEIIEDARKRSDFAMRWLRELIDYARGCGLAVIGVVELNSGTPAQNAETIKRIIAAYPGITTLEIITIECGGTQVAQNAAEQEAHLRNVFCDEELMANPVVKAAYRERLRQFHGVMLSLKKAIDVMPLIRPFLKERGIGFAIGSYSKCASTIMVSMEIMKKYLPSDVLKTYLIQYGSCKVNTQLDAVAFSAADWQDSLLTNWFEFDGSIYVMQKAIYGIYNSIRKAADAVGPDGRITGMNILTWRIAENRLAIGYVARALIDPSVTPEIFMRDYCRRFGISRPGKFIGMIRRVEEAENFVNYKMFNIAFCMPNLCMNEPGVGSIPAHPADDFRHIIREYDAIATQCEEMLARTTDHNGIKYLRMFMSRTRASYWHLRAVFAVSALIPICGGKTHADLTAAEKSRVSEICDEALTLAVKYLETIASDMPDRGSQGLLISYYLNFPAYFHHLKTRFTVGEDECLHRTGPFSSPDGAGDEKDTGLVCPVPYV